MKIISYNCRGHGGRLKKREVNRLVIDQRPDVLCVYETKLLSVEGYCVLCCGEMRICSLLLKSQRGG